MMQTDTVNRLNGVTPPSTALATIKPVTTWNVLKATTIKDLQIQWRYRANFVGNIIGLAIRVMYFLLLTDVISLSASETLGRQLSGSDLFVFFQGAVMLFVFNGVALGAPLEAVNRDLYNGTLEFLYTNPSSRYAYYVGTVFSNVIVSQIVFFPLFLVLVYFSSTSFNNMLMVLLVCVTLFVALVPMGVMVALLGLVWRQVGSVVGIVYFSFEFLSGAYLPVSALPAGVQYVSYLLPFTWAYDLIRYYSFGGEWKLILPYEQEWGVLVIFAVVFTMLSRYLLRKAERRMKQEGLNLI